MQTVIAVLNKKCKNATETVVTMLKAVESKKAHSFAIASPSDVRVETDLEALRDSNFDSHILIGSAFPRTASSDELQPIEVEKATMIFVGRVYSAINNTSILETIASDSRRCNEILTGFEGDFAFVIAEPNAIVAGRDTMGIRPLYYGEGADIVALSSERKILWKAGINDAVSFPTGHTAVFSKDGCRFKPFRTLAYKQPRRISMKAAAKRLQALLEDSVRKRVAGLERVAVAFSGGLDSCIIAFLAKKSEVNVDLIHVSLKNQPEIEYARQVADSLHLPIHVCQYTETDIERVLPKVLWAIEEPDPINTSIGIPVFWAAENAAKIEFRVMLAGQGADELFGGYRRYVDDYLHCGYEKARRGMFNDVTRLYEASLERDYKICNYHDVELRVPFVTPKIAKFAASLPLELKIEKFDTLRKLVLREAARGLGLPRSVVEKPKKAIQYATGVNNALKRIAKRNGSTTREYLDSIFELIKEKMIGHE
jgi:asparagine synthase (glutamine-hydrolysing)